MAGKKITLKAARDGVHKYKVVIEKEHKNGAVTAKTVKFGAKGYSDYTQHKDKARMERYVVRHSARENWTASGLETAGFWSRWILWNKPDFGASIRSTERKFGIKISADSVI